MIIHLLEEGPFVAFDDEFHHPGQTEGAEEEALEGQLPWLLGGLSVVSRQAQGLGRRFHGVVAQSRQNENQ